jgi:hypothetical protein
MSVFGSNVDYRDWGRDGFAIWECLIHSGLTQLLEDKFDMGFDSLVSQGVGLRPDHNVCRGRVISYTVVPNGCYNLAYIPRSDNRKFQVPIVPMIFWLSAQVPAKCSYVIT